ncbi:MAG: cytochrome c3 family protein [Tepidisphaeraceae bacterium]|jgi:predicted CXXCH cytochrome family protein
MAATTRHFQFGRRPAYAIAILAILSMLAVGCSVRKNYKTLSFFFDGVPDPNAPVKASLAPLSAAAGPNGEPAPVKMYRHKPYAEGKCGECHAADKKHLVTVKAELCVKCHAPAVNQYPVMHAPVAIGQCLWCHEPHESDSPRLLKTTAPTLCMQCHDPELLPADVKPHQMADQANCLACHVGHGGAKASLLLVDNPTISPITARLNPSTQASPGASDSGPGGGPP